MYYDVFVENKNKCSALFHLHVYNMNFLLCRPCPKQNCQKQGQTYTTDTAVEIMYGCQLSGSLTEKKSTKLVCYAD